MTNRINWIDYAKAFAIFCVVLLHANVPYPAKGLIRVWVIPLFFFLSGVFANTQRYSTFKDFMKEKGIHILIPYLCFNVITYLFWLFLGRHFGYDASMSPEWWKPLLGMIYGEYSGFIHYIPIWFLACLFTTETLYYLLFCHIQNKTIYWLVVGIIATIGGLNYYFDPIPLPWGLHIAFPMMVFYATGAFFAEEIRTDSYHILSLKYAYLWIAVSAAIVAGIYLINPGEVLVFKNEYGNYFLFFIGAYAGIICILMLCRLLETYASKQLSWLAYIGQNTLIILCLHLIMFSFIKGITYFLFHLPLEIYETSWVIVALSIADIILLIPVIMTINRFCPFITGKSRISTP